MEPVRIDVTTPSRRYVITLADGVLDRLTHILDEARLPARRFVVSSPLVWRFHGQRFAKAAAAETSIALVHVPTTLLAQVDSAIGGKVGVNHVLGKNLIGAFYQPQAVVVDPSVLSTLPRREFRAGLYEVIKYGMTSSPALFDRIGRERSAIFGRNSRVLTEVI